jgi:aquaporin Z
MLVIFQVATGSKEQGMFAGIAIGGMVTMASLFAGPICGASMNPARSIGPGLISGQMNGLWIYMTAPIMGAALATLVWKYFSNAHR